MSHCQLVHEPSKLGDNLVLFLRTESICIMWEPAISHITRECDCKFNVQRT